MKKKKMSIRNVVAIGIGTALFVVLSYVSIPLVLIPNTSIQTRVALLSYMTAVFGPTVGGAIGLFGHMLADAMQYGSVWWSWVLPEGVFGIILGLFYRYYAVESGDFHGKKIVVFHIVQVCANVMAWGVVATCLDVLIYAEPLRKAVAQGILACIGNSITVSILGVILASAYTKMKFKANSLSKELD